MNRERALKVVMVLVGLLFSTAIYPVTMILWHRDQPSYEGAMGLSLYVTLGILLLIAVRNPSAHRSLIAFAAWSSFAHAVVMSMLGLEIAEERAGFVVGAAVLVVIGMALVLLAPGKQSDQRAAVVAA